MYQFEAVGNIAESPPGRQLSTVLVQVAARLQVLKSVKEIGVDSPNFIDCCLPQHFRFFADADIERDEMLVPGFNFWPKRSIEAPDEPTNCVCYKTIRQLPQIDLVEYLGNLLELLTLTFFFGH